jgi:hypothetical protein
MSDTAAPTTVEPTPTETPTPVEALPASTEAAPLEQRATSTPALPDPQPEPTEPTPADPIADDDDDEQAPRLPLPQTLEEAHAEIERLREWKQKNSLKIRQFRDGRRSAEQSATALADTLEKTQQKLDTASTQLTTARQEAEAATAAKSDAEAIVERHRKAIVERFPEADRELAEQQPLDLLTSLYERLVGRPLFQQPAPPSSTRVPVATKPGSPPQPKSLQEYFGKR